EADAGLMELPGPFGDFRIRREVARGGMGVVYEAEQVSLGRRVALKTLPFVSILDPKALQRFRNEAAIAARLHHSHIVPIHAVGCEGGVNFFAMQYIEGLTLAEIIQELRRDPASSSSETVTALTRAESVDSRSYCIRCARVGIQAAEALDHAHGQGIVHRDVKPANLIVDGNGHVWITDFGLAQGRRDCVDHRSDIFSLGTTLYELLTLKHAFPGDGAHRVIQEVVSRDPVSPSRINRAVPQALQTILLKAMAKSPAARYRTAKDMALDLRRFLDDRPILARRPPLSERVARWLRRHRTLAWSGAVALVLATVGTALLVRERVGVLHERERAEATYEAHKLGTELRAKAMEAFDRRDDEKAVDFYREAIDHFQLLVDFHPDEFDHGWRLTSCQLNCATALGNLGRSEEALEYIDLVIRRRRELLPKHPTHPHGCNMGMYISAAYQLRGDTLWALCRLKEAEEAYREGIAVIESFLDTRDRPQALGWASIQYGQLGLLLSENGSLEEARESFRHALRQPPDHFFIQIAQAWLLASCAEDGLRNPERAIELAQRALAGNEHLWEPWRVLGTAQYRAGEYGAAVKSLKESVSKGNEGNGFDWCLLAMAYCKLGDRKRAREWYERRLELSETRGRKHEYGIGDLRKLQIEAANLLGLPR
ncbi:MAG: protein kinase domain-containing protein, partial [Planctomycetota bacterium]